LLVIFASPDFGAAGVIALVVLGAYAFALVCAMIGVAGGVVLVRTRARRAKILGVVLLIAGASLPFTCWFGPSQVFRIEYGNYPLGRYPNGKIHNGMTRDDVLAILGTPHETHNRGDEETWMYYLDSFGMGWFAVYFDINGHVYSQGGN
jgi:hypothetical protein